jgi:hypothetical protein
MVVINCFLDITIDVDFRKQQFDYLLEMDLLSFEWVFGNEVTSFHQQLKKGYHHLGSCKIIFLRNWSLEIENSLHG